MSITITTGSRRESGWDLNYPASLTATGHLAVPLFSYLVLDADSLINLNQAGNLSALAQSVAPARQRIADFAFQPWPVGD